MDKRQELFQNFEVPDTPRIKKVAKFIKGYFKRINGISVLECGACKGGVADLLSGEGADCCGIDINHRDIPGLKMYQADLNSGFGNIDKDFDVIFAGEVMEHLFDDSKFIRECKKFLRSDGILIITVPNITFSVNRLRLLFGKMPMFAYAPYHYHIYNKGTLVRMIEEQGFSILKCSSSHVFFSTRRNAFGKIFEILGDIFPSMGAHLIVYAKPA